MPAIRGTYTTHPQTGDEGLWFELSTSAPGVLTGAAKSAWPSPAGKTLANYQTELQKFFQDQCNLPAQGKLIFGQQPPAGWFVDGSNNLVPMIVEVVLTISGPASLSDISQVSLTNIEVRDGALKSYKV